MNSANITNSRKRFGLTCPAVCFWDIAEHRLALQFQDILTKEIHKELLDKLGASFFLGSAIYDQPGISLNYENLKSQIDTELHGLSLEHYKLKMITEELCLAAVSTRGIELRYVPDRFKTQALCFAAVKNDNRALEYVPPALRTFMTI